MKLAGLIKGVQHLGIPVVDVDKACEFYRENLGFELIHRKVVYDIVDGAIDAAFVKCGDMVVELYKPSTLKDIELRKDGIIDHYAIDAPDYQVCIESVQRKGLIYHSSTPNGSVVYENVGPKGVTGTNYVGPNGEVIELCHDFSKDYTGKCGLQGWSHLAIKVRNLDISIAFYEKLGFEKCADGYLDTPVGRLEIGFVEKNGFQIEIIQVCPAMLEELNSRGRGHIDHIALDVTDVQEAFAYCKNENFTLLTPVIKELSLFEHGVKYIMIEDPDGAVIELNQKL